MTGGLILAGKVVLALLSLFSFGFFHYILCTVIAQRPWNRRAMIRHSVVMMVETFLTKVLNAYFNSGTVLALAAVIVLAYWVYEARGRQWLSLTLRFLFGIFGMELFCSVLLYGVSWFFGIPAESIFLISVSDFLNVTLLAWTVVLTNLASLAMTLVVILFRKVKGLLFGHVPRVKNRSLGIYVRLILMMTIGIAMITVTASVMIDAIRSNLFIEMFSSYIILMVSSCLFMGVCLSYFVQDVRYLQQLSRNETLEHQQAMNASLLTSLRSFRHNTVNMLYGFEGAILSGDTGTIKQYYREMTEKCALVNNENIVALERIANPSVSALLLRAVERARQENLPIQLYVQDGLRFGKGLPDSDLCEVLGVLVDNAIEAALQADVKQVTMEMRNVDDAMEVIVKNTYPGEVTEQQMMNSNTSTKPGHSGQGLRSVRDILARYRNAFLNLQISSQYVTAQLIIQH